jgi:hypothetical protein
MYLYIFLSFLRYFSNKKRELHVAQGMKVLSHHGVMLEQLNRSRITQRPLKSPLVLDSKEKNVRYLCSPFRDQYSIVDFVANIFYYFTASIHKYK